MKDGNVELFWPPIAIALNFLLRRCAVHDGAFAACISHVFHLSLHS